MKKVLGVIILLLMVLLIIFLMPQANSFMYVLNRYYLFGVELPKKYNGEWREWDKEYKLTKKATYKDGILNGPCEVNDGDFYHCLFYFKDGLPDGNQVIEISGDRKIVTWKFKGGYPSEQILTKLGDDKNFIIIENNAFKDEPEPSDIFGVFSVSFKEVNFDFYEWYSKSLLSYAESKPRPSLKVR